VTQEQTHWGVIYTLNKSFPRGERRTAGRLVRALDALLKENPEQPNLEWWLGT
jgi:hypothetical protein